MMAGEYWSIPGLLAGADLSAKQYYVVKFASTAGEVVASTAGSASHAGLLQNDPADGEVADVAVLGIALGYAEGAITVGDHVTSNSTGQVQTTTTANDHLIGTALEAATTAGDLIAIALAPSNY